MILTFDREHLKRLVAATEAATNFAPTLDQLYDPSIRKDRRMPPEGTFPTYEDIDTTKVPPALQLAADHGVYLLSNAAVNLPKGARRDVAYAHEANPDKVPFDEWWDVRARVFGGDDGVEPIPLPDIKAWLAKSNYPNAQLELTPTQIRYF